MSENKTRTPLMQQYWSVKNQHLDKVLLFRMGDFFEMFHDDAIIAAPILNIALTRRNKKSNDDTPMCGMPHHSIATPIAKLLAAGHKVAICDQVENPSEAKGLVKREVTRILSPGMVFDPETLDETTANYLCCFDDQGSVSFLDTSTGENFYYMINNENQIEDLIKILKPVELVLEPSTKRKLGHNILKLTSMTSHKLQEKDDFKNVPTSMALLFSYASYMQGAGALNGLKSTQKKNLLTGMQVSETVFQHLEIFNISNGETRGSLFNAINRTKTSAGARELKSWLNFPLTSVSEIQQRLDRVQYWYADPAKNKAFRKILMNIFDIERRLTKINSNNAHAKDVLSLCESLEAGISATQFYDADLLEEQDLKAVIQTVERIRETINVEAPVNFKHGGVIAKGFLPELDEFIELAENSQQLLSIMEAEERVKLGVPTLKIKYNNVFGYFIEVTKTHSNKIPEHYKRKQTLANAERYVTPELHTLEQKVLSAQTKRVQLEVEIFNDLKSKIMSAANKILKASEVWSTWDVASSMAWLALEYNYVRPRFSDDRKLKLIGSRHPVVEQTMEKSFVANNLTMEDGQCMLLTGPNMAGKSTLMRQVALTALMAQIGSFVPAKSAQLPIFDKIFTRIGASDFISEGLSTFMVEMKEAATIIKDSTKASLVVLDEIGRGTSTYDGMSLAQALLEYLVEEKQCLTFFATHYHELTGLEAKYQNIINAHMSIREDKGEISFLHSLVNGAANRSYGIHVAKLAGLPSKITKRAQSLLEKHETFSGSQNGQMSLLDVERPQNTPELTLDPKKDELFEQIRTTSIQSMTPIDALNKIAAWQQKLS